jgi:hypothetical protein
MGAAELLFHRRPPIFDMAGECKQSFAFPKRNLSGDPIPV